MQINRIGTTQLFCLSISFAGDDDKTSVLVLMMLICVNGNKESNCAI
jgi:hypothetical protein